MHIGGTFIIPYNLVEPDASTDTISKLHVESSSLHFYNM